MINARITNEEFVKVWSVFRLHKLTYIITYGCMMFGFPVTTFATLIKIYIFNINTDYSSSDLIYNTILAIVMGLGWGYMTFQGNEKRYNLLSND